MSPFKIYSNFNPHVVQNSVQNLFKIRSFWKNFEQNFERNVEQNFGQKLSKNWVKIEQKSNTKNYCGKKILGKVVEIGKKVAKGGKKLCRKLLRKNNYSAIVFTTLHPIFNLFLPLFTTFYHLWFEGGGGCGKKRWKMVKKR